MGINKLLGFEEESKEIVIGLVGAIGSRLTEVTNILTAILNDELHFHTEQIRVSKDILEKNNDLNFESNTERFNVLMDEGNRLRKKANEYLVLEIASLIAEKRQINKSHNKRAYIINSLKHEAEIKALRTIYGTSFFQISLYEPASKRKNTLVNESGMSADEAENLINRDEGENNSYGQHTRAAFHLADYFLKYDKTSEHVKSACRRFLNLVFGHPNITPTFNEFATYLAFITSLRSADLSRQVGAVIAHNQNIISLGSNDVPKFGGGLYWPLYNYKDGSIYDEENGRDYMIGEDSNSKEKANIIQSLLDNITEKFPHYFEDKQIELKTLLEQSQIKDITEYGRVVHAEMDALLTCSRTNASTQGATMYVTTFPCHNCAKHILAAGIKKVIFVEPYPKSKALNFHKESIGYGEIHDENDKLIFKPFVGVGARSFLNLFSLSLGTGNELQRKTSNGDALKWDSKNAKLRTPSRKLLYREYEKLCQSKLSELKDED